MNATSLRLLVCAVITFLAAAAPANEVGVRIRFGLTDDSNTDWDGTVTVSPGRVSLISGWRFLQGDKVDGTTGWKAATRPSNVPAQRNNNPAKAAAQARAEAAKNGTPVPEPAPKGKGKGGGKNKKKQGGGIVTDNGVILALADVTEDSVVSVKTLKGDFTFKLAEIPYGKFAEKLDGAVEVERVAATTPLAGQRADEDFPAAATGPDGTSYIAYVSFTPGLDRDDRAKQWDKEPTDLSFLSKLPGADQIWLRVVKNGKAGEPIAITPGGQDLYKCAVTVDGQGQAWVVWAQNRNYPKKSNGNFDIWARSVKDGQLSAPVQLSTAEGNDVAPVAATDASGHVWVAWMGARDSVFRILERHQTAGGWTEERLVSSQKRNCWDPAIAADAKAGGKVAIAWDTYDKGDYDVWVREFAADGQPAAPRPVANSDRYEARPCLTYDHSGGLWIAWEESGPTWGKDWGALVKSKGIPLYRDRQIGLRILKDGQWFETEGAHTLALPGSQGRKRIAAQRVPSLEPESETRKQAQEAENRAGQAYNNLSKISCDRDGRIWLLARSRANDFRQPTLGSVWMEHAAYYEGKKWTGPILIPHSDNLLYNVPAVTPAANGGLLVAHSTDHRQDRHAVGKGPGGGNISLATDNDPFDNDVYLSRLEISGQPAAAVFRPAQAPEANPGPSAATLKELEDVARCRAQRVTLNGNTYRIMRGEFHRHTEISGDGGNDGPLLDMWRYAIDVASMDWIGCGDHDNGAGREYPWWLTQKTTDAFQLPGHFDPMFTYERSVRYPEGHRNVVFAQRGVRTLPRLPKVNEEDPGHAPDTQMFYKYLHLFGGVCASHTSATDMGTDWRDNDPEVEPMVEVYQGCRQNYERPGAPRCPTSDDAIGGWRPKGFINLAFQKGYKFAFESSSDHNSTHISYCLVYAEDATRDAVENGMKARRVYAATDNIVADYRCNAGGREHFMGEEFSTKEAPTLKIKLHGTGPFAKVVIVKDDVEIKTFTPNTAQVDLSWTDPKPSAGKTSYYYVRGEQAPDQPENPGELVWVSPMWITYQGK